MVYEVECECDATYVGQTAQYIGERFKQHVKGGVTHSSLSAHLRNSNHKVEFNNVKVLCTESSIGVRLAKEAIHIRKRNGRLNSQLELRKISDCFKEILTNVKFEFNL